MTTGQIPIIELEPAESQLSELISSIGADGYTGELEALHEAGYTGIFFEFADQVAHDLKGRICSTLVDKAVTQIDLESIIEGGKARSIKPTYDIRQQTLIWTPESLMYAAIRKGLAEYYYGPAQTHPNFRERKQTRSSQIGKVSIQTAPDGSSV